MAPTRIMFIRHAEKPSSAAGSGVTDMGVQDDESLAVRGWQRAGALCRFFSPRSNDSTIEPNVIYASKVADHSKSERPLETVTPLAALMTLTIEDKHKKEDIDALAQSIMKKFGRVLVCWEHQLIPAIIGKIVNPPPSNMPASWPDDRFDMIWILDRTDSGSYSFSQLPQMLLPGDSDTPIS